MHFQARLDVTGLEVNHKAHKRAVVGSGKSYC